jgi:hypothetical protein
MDESTRAGSSRPAPGRQQATFADDVRLLLALTACAVRGAPQPLTVPCPTAGCPDELVISNGLFGCRRGHGLAVATQLLSLAERREAHPNAAVVKFLRRVIAGSRDSRNGSGPRRPTWPEEKPEENREISGPKPTRPWPTIPQR